MKTSLSTKAPKIHFESTAFDSCLITPKFSKFTKSFQTEIKNLYQDPYSTHSKRFSWDFWSVKDQYRLHRTLPSAIFNKKDWDAFLAALTHYGRTVLGCQMISHPWLSAYTDGCFQNLHSDVPHGPYSFVLPISVSQNFKGGETIIAKPKLLSYFHGLGNHDSHELDDFIQKIKPTPHQLTVFDPRYPHGVNRVEGAESLLNARMVIHGWFTEPRPMISGGLSLSKMIRKTLSALDSFAYAAMEKLEPLHFKGPLTLRLHIHHSGAIKSIQVMRAHLLNSVCETIPKSLLQEAIQTDIPFPKSNKQTEITLPIQI